MIQSFIHITVGVIIGAVLTALLLSGEKTVGSISNTKEYMNIMNFQNRAVNMSKRGASKNTVDPTNIKKKKIKVLRKLENINRRIHKKHQNQKKEDKSKQSRTKFGNHDKNKRSCTPQIANNMDIYRRAIKDDHTLFIQTKNIMSYKKFMQNKWCKRNYFENTSIILLDTLGGNTSTLLCPCQDVLLENSSLNSTKVEEDLETLKNCTTSLNDLCGQIKSGVSLPSTSTCSYDEALDSSISAPNGALTCANAVTEFRELLINLTRTTASVGDCSLWINSLKLINDTIMGDNCKLKQQRGKLMKRKNKCQKGFVSCRQAQRNVIEYVYMCKSCLSNCTTTKLISNISASNSTPATANNITSSFSTLLLANDYSSSSSIPTSTFYITSSSSTPTIITNTTTSPTANKTTAPTNTSTSNTSTSTPTATNDITGSFSTLFTANDNSSSSSISTTTNNITSSFITPTIINNTTTTPTTTNTTAPTNTSTSNTSSSNPTATNNITSSSSAFFTTNTTTTPTTAATTTATPTNTFTSNTRNTTNNIAITPSSLTSTNNISISSSKEFTNSYSTPITTKDIISSSITTTTTNDITISSSTPTSSN